MKQVNNELSIDGMVVLYRGKTRINHTTNKSYQRNTFLLRRTVVFREKGVGVKDHATTFLEMRINGNVINRKNIATPKYENNGNFAHLQ